MQSKFWNDRYADSEYAYGVEPNGFLKQQYFKPNSKILCLAEGEGRNAVYLARQGHVVTAIDYSVNGLKKTQQLASTFGVHVDTICIDLGSYLFEQNEWDAIICIFGHFPPLIRSTIHSQIYGALKKGGKLVIEAYSKGQITYRTGGPLDINLLYSINELEKDFSDFRTINIEEILRNVSEGKYHNGLASVIQLVGEKQI